MCIKCEVNYEDNRSIHIDESWRSNIGFHTIREKDKEFNQLMYSMISQHGSTCAQIFNGSPAYSFRSRVSREDAGLSQFIAKELGFKLFIHAPNSINISHRDDNKLDAGINRLATDLYAAELTRSTCVLHCGSGDIERARDTLERSIIPKLNNSVSYPLLLENAAEIKGHKSSKKHGGTLDELKYLTKGLDKVGICIDTQHLFSQGEYNIVNVKDVDRFFKDFDKKIGRDKLRLIHLNDSKVKFGHGRDLHEEVGEGYIWGKATDSLYRLIEYARDRSVPIIIEYISDIQTLHDVKTLVS
jgi:deoxyribonuclease IV